MGGYPVPPPRGLQPHAEVLHPYQQCARRAHNVTNTMSLCGAALLLPEGANLSKGCKTSSRWHRRRQAPRDPRGAHHVSAMSCVGALLYPLF